MSRSLKKKLDDIKDFQIYSDEWFQLNSKIELDRSSQSRKEATKNNFENVMFNLNSRICIQLNSKTICKNYPVIFLILTILSELHFHSTLTLLKIKNYF